jgi:hypothetical protein
MTKPPEGTVRLTLNINQSLHHQFKVVCVHAGQPMTDVILDLIKAYVKHPPATSPRKAAKK